MYFPQKYKINGDPENMMSFENFKKQRQGILDHWHVFAAFHFLCFFSHNDDRTMVTYFAKTIYRTTILYDLMLLLLISYILGRTVMVEKLINTLVTKIFFKPHDECSLYTFQDIWWAVGRKAFLYVCFPFPQR